MKKLNIIAILFTALAIVCPSVSYSLTLQEAVLSTNRVSSPGSMTPAADGQSYFVMEKGSKINQVDYKTGNILATVFDASTARDCNVKRFDGFAFSDDESMILLYSNKELIYRYSFKADYYVYERRHNKLVKLSDEGDEEAAIFSPDARMVAFVKDNNIYLKKLDFNSIVPVTVNGKKGEVINGVPDWVYQEEFGILNSMTFSPDSRTLCFLQWNESKVRNYSFPLYEGACHPNKEYALYPGEFTYKYPLAGTDNSVVKVVSYDIDNRKIKVIPMPQEDDYYIPNIQYAPGTERLMITTLNRNQNSMRMYEANPLSTVCKLIYTDKSQTWLDIETIMDMTHHYADGFVIASARSGYMHLYKYSLNGTLLQQLTSGDWNVTSYYGYSAADKSYYFQSTKMSPITRVVSKRDVKGVITDIAAQKGWNDVKFSSDYSYYVLNYSNITTPNVYTLFNNKSGKKVRTLEDNTAYNEKLGVKSLPKKEFFTFSANGNSYNGYMIKPVDFNEAKKYPVIMTQYSGPGSQQVKDSWKLDWEQYAALNGYIIVCVDGRGTGGRGEEWEKVVYMHLGKYESIDQVAAANYMRTLSYVEKDKIGIYGWSYGGYETLMAMSTKGGNFAAGVAVAPVTDWRYYDTIYAERFMRTPQENESGYRESSAINNIPALSGNLLIMSGTADDNVHIANTMEYVSHLTLQNKICDMMVYPNMNHSIYYCDARYPLYMRILNHFDRYLK